jgi:hypothetical protein
LLPDNQACSFIGYVNSTNFVRERTWQNKEDLESEWENSRSNISREVLSSHLDKSRESRSTSLLRTQSASPIAIPGSFPSKPHVLRPEWSSPRIPIALYKVPSLDTRLDLSNMAEDISALTSHPTFAPDQALGGLLSLETKLERSDSYHVQFPISTPQYTMP